jgi:hypothetical protein
VSAESGAAFGGDLVAAGTLVVAGTGDEVESRVWLVEPEGCGCEEVAGFVVGAIEREEAFCVEMRRLGEIVVQTSPNNTRQSLVHHTAVHPGHPAHPVQLPVAGPG